MIRREKGKQLVLCDNCEELLGIYEDFDEAKEAIRKAGWTTRRDNHLWVNLCKECQQYD